MPLTPRQIVAELDKFIVGQADAKRAVALALRNRWRRQQVPEDFREEITPKNIILIGPTGVGKTEIARRLARLSDSPFYKVEASKFTEVGYVGRDVESMIRDLTELTINQLKAEARQEVTSKAREAAEERLLDILLPGKRPSAEPPDETAQRTRERLRQMLREGKLDERQVEVEVSARQNPRMEIVTSQGVEELGINLRDLFGQFLPGQTQRRKVRVAEALEMLAQEEAGRLVDMEQVTALAIRKVEQSGIIFLDEIDKIAVRGQSHGPDVSREGVQRDLLPIVEGTTVMTKHGPVRTDHILFIASGAFHMSKPADLIPELQGRFPIRVELKSLGAEEFVRILTEPANALPLQYQALLRAEGVELEFSAGALRAVAEIAHEINETNENIGARRLHTVMERVLEDVAFRTPDDIRPGRVVIDENTVRETLAGLTQDQDLSRYIL